MDDDKKFQEAMDEFYGYATDGNEGYCVYEKEFSTREKILNFMQKPIVWYICGALDVVILAAIYLWIKG
jgi:hypothetical protein